MNKCAEGVAVFLTNEVQGEVVIKDCKKGVDLIASFTKLPPGKHGFHIHKAGDLRGEGCMGLCEHYDIGKHVHGDQPSRRNKERHTGDLGNIQIKRGKKSFKKKYCIPQTSVKALWGRSIIVHADEDDLGKGTFEDSKTTGHSGKRMACAIIGRSSTTRKKSKK